jgi:hypothetical protein
VTTEDHRPVAPGRSLGRARRTSNAAASSARRHVPGGVPVVHSVRPARAEPSWGRVLLTTVELWVSRRLRHAGFLRRQVRGRRSGNRARARVGRPQTKRRWSPGVPKLTLAVVAATAVAVVGLHFAGAFATDAPRAVRAPDPRHAAAPSVSARSVSARQARSAVSAQSEAVSWIAGQVSTAATIGCYPVMCAALQAHGISARRLVPLASTLTGVPGADVIATLPSADGRVVDQYAPALIASFGSGSSRIEVRTVARAGAAAYQSALRADLAARRSAAVQLLKNQRIKFSMADAARLTAGEVDSRLLATLAALSTQFKLRVTAFGDCAPGAPVLYREVTVASNGAADSTATLAAALAMVKAQEGPYLPAHSAIVRLGTRQAVLNIEFASPSPLGLLTMTLTADVRGGGPGPG